MRRPVATTTLTLVTALTALTVAGCGGDSGNAKTAPAQGAGSTGSAEPAGGSGNQAAGAAIPQTTVTEDGGGNDGPAAKLPHGTSAEEATAAGMGNDGNPVISVTNTDTSCIPDMTSVHAGKVWLKVTNKGTKITEMYLEGPDGEEQMEVENVKVGASGAIKATLKEGMYLIACEPGMSDTQIRTPLTVTAKM